MPFVCHITSDTGVYYEKQFAQNSLMRSFNRMIMGQEKREVCLQKIREALEPPVRLPGILCNLITNKAVLYGEVEVLEIFHNSNVGLGFISNEIRKQAEDSRAWEAVEFLELVESEQALSKHPKKNVRAAKSSLRSHAQG